MIATTQARHRTVFHPLPWNSSFQRCSRAEPCHGPARQRSRPPARPRNSAAHLGAAPAWCAVHPGRIIIDWVAGPHHRAQVKSGPSPGVAGQWRRGAAALLPAGARVPAGSPPPRHACTKPVGINANVGVSASAPTIALLARMVQRQPRWRACQPAQGLAAPARSGATETTIEE